MELSYCSHYQNLLSQNWYRQKIMPYVPNYVLPLYYNSCMKSCFSYCLMFRINNERSGWYKLIYKIDKLITQIVNKMYITPNCHLYNIRSVYEVQCLSLMYDLCYNNLQFPSLPLYFKIWYNLTALVLLLIFIYILFYH